MLFRRIIFSALIVGVVGGVLLGIGQHFGASQLIYAAEQYEGGAMPGGSGAGEAAHAHGEEAASHSHGEGGGEAAWAPADGAERVTYSVIADVLVAIGFGTLLIIAMYVARSAKGAPLGPSYGALWGLAGFVVAFGAPALGLPPELPGAAAAPLEQRQLWWLATVVVTGAGLGFLAFAPGWKKVIGVALLPIPHLFGAPHPEGPVFSHPNPEAVAALQALHTDFIIATAITNAAFWIVLGVGCGWAVQRWVLNETPSGGNAPAHA